MVQPGTNLVAAAHRSPSILSRSTFFDFGPRLSRRAGRLQGVSGCEASPKGLYSPEAG
jgi:hypothetical protein